MWEIVVAVTPIFTAVIIGYLFTYKPKIIEHETNDTRHTHYEYKGDLSKEQVQEAVEGVLRTSWPDQWQVEQVITSDTFLTYLVEKINSVQLGKV